MSFRILLTTFQRKVRTILQQTRFQEASMPRLFFGVLCVFALAPSLFAQATFGSLIGTVSDPAGAVVAGVKVTVRSDERGVSYGAITNESGNYIITQLSVGDYTAEFEAPG